MQNYFDTFFPMQQEFLNRERLNRSKLGSALLREVLGVKSKNAADLESKFPSHPLIVGQRYSSEVGVVYFGSKSIEWRRI